MSPPGKTAARHLPQTFPASGGEVLSAGRRNRLPYTRSLPKYRVWRNRCESSEFGAWKKAS
jgi:hypothetical protein